MKTKTYMLVRIVREIYEVEATSKKEAAKKEVQDPSAITVVREKIYLKKKPPF